MKRRAFLRNGLLALGAPAVLPLRRPGGRPSDATPKETERGPHPPQLQRERPGNAAGIEGRHHGRDGGNEPISRQQPDGP